MAQYSFDIVSEVDLQEIDNACNQAIKELRGRFDFKGSKSSIEFLRDEKKIRLVGDDDMKLRNLQDMLRSRMASRHVPINALQFKTAEKAFEGTMRQEIALVQGIEQEPAKAIVKAIKETKLKVQASIQGDKVRVTAKSKDDLQSIMAYFRANPPEIPLQFTNYRS